MAFFRVMAMNGGGHGDSFIDIDRTLTAGATTLTITDPEIVDDDMSYEFYATIYGVIPNTVTTTTGEMVLTFDAQSTDMTFRVRKWVTDGGGGSAQRVFTRTSLYHSDVRTTTDFDLTQDMSNFDMLEVVLDVGSAYGTAIYTCDVQYFIDNFKYTNTETSRYWLMYPYNNYALSLTLGLNNATDKIHIMGTPTTVGVIDVYGIKCISTGGSTGGSSWDYSTDEVDTKQKWVDGKEIYCKVIDGTFNFTSNNSVELCPVTGIYRLLDARAIGDTIPSATSLQVYFNNNKVMGHNSAQFDATKIILYYTKTELTGSTN